MSVFEAHTVRHRFPALEREVGGLPAVYADGPGGTQVPDAVIDAMGSLLARGSANLHGPFVTSREIDDVVERARSAVADLVNAESSEIAFGQNMTSLTMAMSRALGATWREGDNIVVSRLDHDANVWPWVLAAEDSGADVRWLDFDPERGCVLDVGALADVLDNRTRLVAVTRASNAVGTIVDVKAVAERAHAVDALVYVDAVHFTPHGVVDVRDWDCDFLVCSAYKFFGPHTGCLYGKTALLDKIDAYKVRPAPSAPPEKWETGTQSFESLAGIEAAVNYLASLGEGAHRRTRLVSAMTTIGEHERSLAEVFLKGLGSLEGVSLYGRETNEGRTPTFAVEVAGLSASEVAEVLGEQGIFVWSGDYYAVEVMKRLGVHPEGLVRIGFVHYNTPEEVERVLDALAGLTEQSRRPHRLR